MKKTLLLLLFGLLVSCAAPNSSNNKSDSAAVNTNSKSSDSSKSSAPKVTAAADTSKWVYSDEVDKMTSKTTYIAEITSTNQLDLKPPYDGDNDATLYIRKKDEGTDVILKIKKGQFLVGVEGANVRIRFDENKAMTFSCYQSTDDDPTILFFNSTSKLISNLEQSKKMLIEATMFNDGNQIMEFDVDGLKWSH